MNWERHRYLCVFAVVLLTVSAACSGGGTTSPAEQQLVQNKRLIQITGGGVPGSIEVGDYPANVTLPPGSLFVPGDGHVMAQHHAGTVPDADGNTTVTLNTEATGLVTFELPGAGADGDPHLMAVVPKGTGIVPQPVNLDTLETAAALVFMQPGLADDNPIRALLLLEAIKSLPETLALRDLLDQRLPTDPDMLVDPTTELAEAVTVAVQALFQLADATPPPAQLTIQGSRLAAEGDPRDQNDGYLYDTDGLDMDRVAVSGRNIEAGTTGTQELVLKNTKRRWVLYWLDPRDAAGSPDQSLLPVGAATPRRREIPRLTNLLFDIAFKLWQTRFDFLQTFNQVRLNIFSPDPTESTPSVDVRAQQAWALKGYGFGRGSGVATGERGAVAQVMTVVTDLVVPLVNVVMDYDMKAGSWFARFSSTRQLFMDLAASFALDLQDVIAKWQAGARLDAVQKLMETARAMVLSPEFVELLSRHGPFAVDLPRKASNILLKLLSPFAKVDFVLSVVNFGFAVGEVLDAWLSTHDYDLYHIETTGQTPVVPPYEDLSDTDTTGVGLTGALETEGGLRLFASVTTSSGKPLGRLTLSNFDVSEAGPTNSGPAQVTRVENLQDSTLAYTVLVVDRSGSMGGQPIIDARNAASLFVDNIGANDRVMIVTFSNTSQVLVDFESDQNVLKNAIATITAGGGTRLFDALDTALGQLEPKQGARAVVAMTDGKTSGDAVTVNDIVQRAQDLNTVIHTIGLGGADQAPLQSLAGGTGGSFFNSPTSSQLDQVYQSISDQLSSRYLVQWITTGLPGEIVDATVTVTYRTALGTFGDQETFRFLIPGESIGGGGGTDDHSDFAPTGTSVVKPSTTLGTIDPSGDQDWFRLPVIAGQSCTIRTILGTLPDSVLEIYTADGITLLARNDDDVGFESRIDYTAESTGTLAVRVISFAGASSGTFSLIIE